MPVIRNDGEEYLSPGEVARMFGVDSRTVTNWANQGKIPCFRTAGNHRRFPLSKLLEVMEGVEGE